MANLAVQSLFFAENLAPYQVRRSLPVQQPHNSLLLLPIPMGIHIHGGPDIRMPQQLLHLLRCGTLLQQHGRIGMAQHVEMKILHALQLMFQPAAGTAHRPAAFICTVGPQADQPDLLIAFRHLFCFFTLQST